MPYSPKTYHKLRVILDAFEKMALTYCLHAQDDDEADKRVEMIRVRLPLDELDQILKTMPRQEAVQGHCPSDKPFECHGVCCEFPCD